MACDNCKNGYITEGGTRKRCKCLIRKELKTYLSEIGKFTNVPDSLQPAVECLSFSDSTFLNIKKEVNVHQINGIVATRLKEYFPTDYTVRDLAKLYRKCRDNNQFSDLQSQNDPLLIILGGLPEEYQGETKDGVEWTDDAYSDAFKQIAGYRQRKGLTTWYIADDNPYNDIYDTVMGMNYRVFNLTNANGLEEV